VVHPCVGYIPERGREILLLMQFKGKYYPIQNNLSLYKKGLEKKITELTAI